MTPGALARRSGDWGARRIASAVRAPRSRLSTPAYRTALDAAGARRRRPVRLARARRAALAAPGAGAGGRSSSTASTTSPRLAARRVLGALAGDAGAEVTVVAPLRARSRGVRRPARDTRRRSRRIAAEERRARPPRRALRARARARRCTISSAACSKPARRGSRAGDAVRAARGAAASAPSSSWWPPRCSSCWRAGIAGGRDRRRRPRPARPPRRSLEQVFARLRHRVRSDRRRAARPHRPGPRPARAGCAAAAR